MKLTDLLEGKLELTEAKAYVEELSAQPITTELLVTLAQALRERMVRIDLGVELLDTCGTGGDGLKTFNVSTAAALVCAELGARVAKHGNIAATSISGSADVLQQLGIPIDLSGQAAVDYFQHHQFLFLFAKLYHPAMKHVAPIRKAIGKRTIFNYLGPLCNPAGAEHQLLGVSDPKIAVPMGEALMQLGSKHVVVVHSDDGLDEVSIAASTQVHDFRPGKMEHFLITPETAYSLAEIMVDSVAQSAEYIQRRKELPAVRQAIAMNAGLALYAADQVVSYQAGYTKAYDHLR